MPGNNYMARGVIRSKTPTMLTRLLILTTLLFPTLASAQLVGDTENGLASYYSEEYNGAETAYNVIYDKNQLVAAHRQFPFNSTVRVKNMENGRSVDVRIIDEGPFIRSRIIELSERAAAAIGLLGKETVPVELTLLSVPGQRAVAVSEPPVVNDPVVTPAPEPRREPTPRPRTYEETQPVTPTPAASTTPAPAPVRQPSQAPAPAPTVDQPTRTEVKNATVADRSKAVRQATFAPGVYKIQLSEVESGKHGVQVGSFRSLDRAMDKVTELQSKWFDNVLLERVGTGTTSTYKVILGPFDTDKSALRYASDLKSRYKIDGFTVELD